MTGELFPTVGTENLLPLPEKWYVERNVNTSSIVNEMFSKLYNRKYSDNGVTGYRYMGEWYGREQDYLHYPRIERTPNGKKCVYSRPQKGYKEISVEQLKAFVMQKEIQDNWYIRGCSELVELMADKSLNDGVYQGMNPTQGYYVPRFSEEPTKWHSWSASELRARGMKEISVKQFKDLILSTKPFVMPEKWYIRGGNNDLMTYLKYKGSGYSGKEKDYGYYPNEHGYWSGIEISKLTDRVEITYAQFFNSLNKNGETMALPLTLPPQKSKERPILGYKLKKEEYKQAVKHIIGTASSATREGDWFEEHFDNNLKQYGFNFSSNSNNVARTMLAKAGVLDLWFEPVYEYAPQLPQIKGKDGKMYSGVFENGKLTYGCAKLNLEWFKNSENRGIGSFTTTNDVFIGVEEVKAIRKYLEYHGWAK